jgi:hypothetical protein
MIQPTPGVTRPYLWPGLVVSVGVGWVEDGWLPEALMETTRGSSKFLGQHISAQIQRTEDRPPTTSTLPSLRA